MAKGLNNKIGGKLKELWANNPLSEAQYRKKRKKLLTSSFLSSDAYDQLMMTAVPDKAVFLKEVNDAQKQTENFKFRHYKLRKTLGSWRWKGVWLQKDQLLPIVFDQDKNGIDFGGAYGPISPFCSIVDFSSKDIFGRKVPYPSLENINFQVDYIFSSHTLEHITNLETTLERLHSILVPNGDLLLHLPAYTCKRWRSGDHSNKKFNDHQWTFYLSSDNITETLKNGLAIDPLVEKHFTVLEKKHTGDNSIWIHAKKK